MSGIIVFLQALLKPVLGRGRGTLLEGTTDPVAYEWLRLGVRAAVEGNREDARYYFVQAVRTDVNFARAWLYLGGVADDPALTLSCLRKALKLDPTNPDIHAGILWARERLGLIQPLPLPREYSAGEERSIAAVWGLPEGLPQPQPKRPDPQQAPAQSSATVLTLEAREAPPQAPAPRQAIEEAPPRPAPEKARPAAPEPGPTLPEWSAAPGRPEQRPLLAPDEAPAQPDEPPSDGSRRLLRRGVRAAIAGNRPRARYFFLKAIAADTSNTRAWLYFGGVADDPSVTLACMERVLQTDPHCAEAQAGVQWSLARMGVSGPTMRWWRS